MYDAINDGRTRPAHRAMDGHIAHIDDPWWGTHFPPNGFRCRCGAIALSEAQAKARGYGTKPTPDAQPDKGWDYHPAKGQDEALRKVGNDKLAKVSGTLATKAQDLLSGRNVVMSSTYWRSAWPGDFPDTLILAPEPAAKRSPFYQAAKNGDLLSAVQLIEEVVPGAELGRLADWAKERPVLVGVHAQEAVSINRIPVALAAWVGERYGLAVERSLVQTNRVGRTGSSGWHRLVAQPTFSGDVNYGERYLMLDDFVGQGATFANLKGYIEAKGGAVIGAVALSGQVRSARLAIEASTLAALRAAYGDLEEWWEASFGYGFERLTESEGRYLLRARSAVTIRNRILEAGQGQID
jgi:hypothetical protein